MSRFSGWLLALSLAPGIIRAGVTNPDISAVGQVVGMYTDDRQAEVVSKPTLELGEAELILDAALNPYLNGAFVFSLSQEGFEIEEAYASVVRGLPLNLGLKVGKYRLGFGRLNPAHPHAYPFISTPRVMDPSIARLLPGEESFNDVAFQLSSLIPVAGSYSLLVSGDMLRGNSFRTEPTGAPPDFGGLVRIVNSLVIADAVPAEIGLSFTGGTNDPVYETRSLVGGMDFKTKIPCSPTVNLTLQGEAVYKSAELYDSLQAATHRRHETRWGWYGFADLHFRTHYNGGLLFQQYQAPDASERCDLGIKPFVGFSVLEESTILRLAYEYFIPHAGRPNQTVEAQFLFCMGPHKAHQF
jgi:hypothetical protein